ncbi:hypothetical protein TCAL_03832 [Tigriopus californicus]|uniref:Delta-1-pyrroline-5-carboxylate synthase n=3 Tax=Tigriopus californicus TaxID=6832 RepID=Q8MUS7_TIGCA|nr:delta-1-pyrroline-5-carboxylate synthase-like [Tigriopus californicus]XP_059082603.1 delta-1-pyrroline-5-carboxylate synthase-like [Tigriopus californicus]AAM48244.1 pyrroline-5-carboxylase synthase [Tigriopus californicus]TRY76870.1 hypothetical protein TCAL_03832 [Tigriopus californicus]
MHRANRIINPAAEHQFFGYSKPNSGVKSQSCRVVLHGGLAPLPLSRKSVDSKVEPLTSQAHLPTTTLGKRSGDFLRPFPPKRLFFSRGLITDGGPSGVKKYGSLTMFSGDHATEGGHSPVTNAFLYRHQLSHAKRIVIKMGSAVITREDGNGLALGRLAAIVEQVSELQNEGRECILITSGAVAFGKQKLAQEVMMSMSMRETISGNYNTKEDIKTLMKSSFKKPNAAVGQSGLQALYETMFRNYGILVGQVLVTKPDFYNDNTRQQLFTTINELLQLNIIPIINTNDAVSPPPQKDEDPEGVLGIKDNDSLAARVAVETRADLAILMSDVDGIYDRSPSHEDARVMHNFNPVDLAKVEFGEKSDAGTGGMESKVRSALWALENGSSVVICNGMKYNTIRKIMRGDKVGSFFTKAEVDAMPVEVLAKNARSGSRRLQALAPEARAKIINKIADSLISRQDEIMSVNELDLRQARLDGVVGAMYSRLAFSPQKIQALATGLKQIAATSYQNVGKVVRRTKVSDTMDLVQRTVPIGVLMVIFESRPDALPQVASLAIASANGLLMKGGKEATNSNNLLMNIVKEALSEYGCADAISMVSKREAIGDLLKMDQYIDLVIPRGSGELVKSIKEQSKMIPVLGHAEGVCHVYVDKYADLEKARAIVKDSKTDYPAACNAMETLLVHEDLLKTPVFDKICSTLKESGVAIFSGPTLAKHLTFGPPQAHSLKHEYGDMACTIEIVKDMYDAIDHIHKFGSSHTDVIVTDNEENAQIFLESVDSACVFANCSSRMADGYRLGLGAEVGISTGRIHARGPVGVEGLLTTKWVLNGDGDIAADYASGEKHFIHQQLPLIDVESNFCE